MSLHNQDIASVFEHIATLLEIEGANPFRIRAYRNAALTVANLTQPLAERMESEAGLKDLPGIGHDLAEKIRELLQTGKLKFLTELESRIPAGLIAMLKIPGLGPKRVRALREQLKLTTLASLQRAAKQGAIRRLSGFGPKLEEQILAELARRQETPERTLWAVAEPLVNDLLGHVQKSAAVKEAVAAGSFRRGRETVGDLDILVTSSHPRLVLQHVLKFDRIAKVLGQGTTKLSFRLHSGLQVDVRVVKPESLGAAWHYFTGSQAHNISLRKRAQHLGLKLNEYGLFKGSRRLSAVTESEVYRRLGLPFIPPELRENLGEIEAAQQGQLPCLLERQDLRGDLHTHSQETDGHDSLETMAAAAKELGYEYLGISDHSRHVSVAHGMDETRLAKQIQTLDRLNARLRGITLLKGIEVDILEDGRLDLPDTLLRELDFTIGSIHYKFNLSEEKQTERILAAMDNPYLSILGHPTGRLLEKRPPYAVNMERIIRGAKERGCHLELNSHPARLDLNVPHLRQARAAGVLVTLSSDAHEARDLNDVRYGTQQARRGWLEASQVLNTRPLNELRRLLKRK